uniref:Uncharacterized protein n=1 Tax=Pithovirus LCPAC304 TaxID=2506594 RepID=A0A481Z9J8_9VIRU|nr:MAG: hypothetical protein LCPAC304_04920 [Pithovirus LCPAC304]
MQDWGPDDFLVSVKNPEISCEYGCTPKECPNSVVCESEPSPEWYFDCHDGVCRDCNMFFGTWLTEIENSNILQLRNASDEECHCCHANKNVFVRHPEFRLLELCVECFREKFYSD